MIDCALPTQLNQPLDQLSPIHTLPTHCPQQNGQSHDPPSIIQSINWHHSTLSSSNLTATTISNQNTPWSYSDYVTHAPAMHMSTHLPACHHNGTHDLKPPSHSLKPASFVPQPSLQIVPEHSHCHSA